ncbi:hypothetical protein DSO57_1031428 [Entomophthora muscae]|uniref:Uncharacterized protein n=1 Tax=Entomophthora muscae TaxID=34485 RepID=A0ACC2TYK9_9FUNG|nr:hypothetical protein DSO57_1031428 [Entomophthora muscae]
MPIPLLVITPVILDGSESQNLQPSTRRLDPPIAIQVTPHSDSQDPGPKISPKSQHRPSVTDQTTHRAVSIGSQAAKHFPRCGEAHPAPSPPQSSKRLPIDLSS